MRFFLIRFFRLVLLIIAFTLLIVSVIQFQRGYRDWQHAQSVEADYQRALNRLEAERDKLKHRVELLKDDTLTKERLVRKRFGLVKPGEIRFKIVKPNQPD